MASNGYSSTKKRVKDKKITIYLKQNVAKPGYMAQYKYKPIHPGKLWAYTRQLSTRELGNNPAPEWTQDTTLFEINWRDDVITLEHLIAYKGVFYEIVRVDTYEGYKDTIKITAKQLGAQPGATDIVPFS